MGLMKILLLAAALLAPTTPAPKPGMYDSLQLAVNPATGVITGSFFDETGMGQFTCGFFLYSDGRPSADGVYSVVTWTSIQGVALERAKGSLRFVNGSALLKLPARAHGGCWNVNPELDQGEDTLLDYQRPAPWREERIVRDAKAWFYSRPDQSAKSAAYVVLDDAVAVLEERGDWLRVDYIGEYGKRRTGWMQKRSLSPLVPPPETPKQ